MTSTLAAAVTMSELEGAKEALVESGQVAKVGLLHLKDKQRAVMAAADEIPHLILKCENEDEVDVQETKHQKVEGKMIVRKVSRRKKKTKEKKTKGRERRRKKKKKIEMKYLMKDYVMEHLLRRLQLQRSQSRKPSV